MVYYDIVNQPFLYYIRDSSCSIVSRGNLVGEVRISRAGDVLIFQILAAVSLSSRFFGFISKTKTIQDSQISTLTEFKPLQHDSGRQGSDQ